MCEPIMKNGRCILGDYEKTDLKICKGCEYHFVKDLKKADFGGVIFHSNGTKENLK